MFSQKKNATTFLELPYGISGRKTEDFDFSSCATYFRFGSVLVGIAS